MKILQSLKRPVFLLALATLAIFQSCSKDSDPTNPLRNTGWQATDDPSVVPQNVSLPDFDGSGSGLPASMDLSAFLPPIGDQGSYGTCVAWAAGYNCKSALEAIKFGLSSSDLQASSRQMSPKYLFTALANDKKGADCNGTDFIPALDVMLTKGIAASSTVPYTNLGNCSQSSLDASWDTDAAKHKIKYYRRIPPTVAAIKTALASKIPVILGAKLDDSFMDWNSESVYQFATSTARVGIHSYHALCIIGYDNTKGPAGAFKVVNSWGQQWGAAGYIWVDYNFMINGFGFGSNPSKPNDKNFLVAVNDEQKPSPTDPNPPATSGVEIAPWVDADYSSPAAGIPTQRKMEFNIYNIGTAKANASDKWGYAYIYYNAFNANDYGIVFYDDFNTMSGGTAIAYKNYVSNTYPAMPPSPAYEGITINCDIPAKDDLAHEFFNDIGMIRTYAMPNTLTGTYYLVLAVDVTDKYTETDESNNLFYTTDQDPKSFTNGVGSRRNVAVQNFKNILSNSDMYGPKANRYRTAVNENNRNAYTPEEIIGFLKKEAKNGKLAQRIAMAKQDKNALKGSLTPKYVK